MYARALAAFLLSLFAAFPCVAYAQDSVFLDDLTSPELQRAIRDGRNDRARADRRHRAERPAHGARQAQRARAAAGREDRARARQRARRAGDRLRAGRQRRSADGAHALRRHASPFPTPTFESVLESAARSFRLHGFRDIVFIGDHGGYQRNEQAVARRLNREWAATPVRVHALAEYYRVTDDATYRASAASRAASATPRSARTRALADTSLALAVDPRLVRACALRGRHRADAADGVHGDPRRASAELGARRRRPHRCANRSPRSRRAAAALNARCQSAVTEFAIVRRCLARCPVALLCSALIAAVRARPAIAAVDAAPRLRASRAAGRHRHGPRHAAGRRRDQPVQRDAAGKLSAGASPAPAARLRAALCSRTTSTSSTRRR